MTPQRLRNCVNQDTFQDLVSHDVGRLCLVLTNQNIKLCQLVNYASKIVPKLEIHQLPQQSETRLCIDMLITPAKNSPSFNPVPSIHCTNMMLCSSNTSSRQQVVKQTVTFLMLVRHLCFRNIVLAQHCSVQDCFWQQPAHHHMSPKCKAPFKPTSFVAIELRRSSKELVWILACLDHHNDVVVPIRSRVMIWSKVKVVVAKVKVIVTVTVVNVVVVVVLVIVVVVVTIVVGVRIRYVVTQQWWMCLSMYFQAPEAIPSLAEWQASGAT